MPFKAPTVMKIQYVKGIRSRLRSHKNAPSAVCLCMRAVACCGVLWRAVACRGVLWRAMRAVACYACCGVPCMPWRAVA